MKPKENTALSYIARMTRYSLSSRFFNKALRRLFVLFVFSVLTNTAYGMEVDYLITNSQIYDGTGNKPYTADVAILGNKIHFIGDRQGITAKHIIDGTGLWLAPGFIDAHSHAMLETEFGKDAKPYLFQGITTVVLGLDGGGTHEVKKQFDLWRTQGIGVNGLYFVGHGHLRRQVMGRENRAPTQDEMRKMKQMVEQAMNEGAYGLSTGLFYVPGTYATTEEVIEIAKVAGQYDNAIYDTHDRDLGAVFNGVGYEASVKEGIRITEESGLKGIFSHYNLQGSHNYGRAAVGAKLINEARDRGIDIWAAHHPYTATQSNLRSYTIPNWVSAGGNTAMLKRFARPELQTKIVEESRAMLKIRGGAEKILLVDPKPGLNGKTLKQLADELGLEPALAAQEILKTGNAAVMNLDLYDHANTHRLAQEAWMMTCTDGRTPKPGQTITHPRTFGAFPKKMRHFVFEEPLLTPEFVIRSFSGLAADFFSLNGRGYIKQGYIADLVLLDPSTYRDLATIQKPQQLSTGVKYLFVNGVATIANGKYQPKLAGQPIPRTAN